MSKVLDKHSKRSDALANLYRAALYLGQGSKEAGLNFLRKAGEMVKLDKDLEDIVKGHKDLETSQQQRYWAEKILDQYHKLRTH